MNLVPALVAGASSGPWAMQPPLTLNVLRHAWYLTPCMWVGISSIYF